MAKPKPIYQSKTTATVGGAAGVVSTLALVLLSFVPADIRNAWGPEGDAAFIALVSALGTAGISRLIAWYRGKV